MQTEKDAEIVGWVGRMGAAGAEHVMDRFAMGRSWAYARLNGLVRDGLLEQKTLLYRQPGLYLATAEGLRWRGLERLGVYRVSPGGFQHAKEVASAAVALHRSLPDWRLSASARYASRRATRASCSRRWRWRSCRVAVGHFTGQIWRSSPQRSGPSRSRWSCRSRRRDGLRRSAGAGRGLGTSASCSTSRRL